MNTNALHGKAAKTTVVFACLLALAAGTARAAIVYLKEGGHLDGALVSSTDSEVVLDTAQGRVRIDRSRVQSIDGQAGAPAPAPAVAPAPVPQEEYRVVRRRRRYYAAPAEGAPDAGRQMLSIDFGLSAPLSDINFSGTSGGGSDSNGVTGPAFGVQYLYYTTPRLAWGAEFDYYQRDASNSTALLPSSEAHAFGDTGLLLGIMKYSLTDRGMVRPFVLVGAGVYRNWLAVDAHPLFGFAWSDTGTSETRRLVDDSAAGGAATARVGVDFGDFDWSTFSLELGWTGLTSATYRPTPQGQALGITGVSGPLNYFTFTGRWGFSF